ncbi:MAG: helix-turn-helix transcriptional regulator [Ruminococcaceae bacterium]|nr:helix-turn-helix transcriptional regulator [Oscillospiraceae bacterium]
MKTWKDYKEYIKSTDAVAKEDVQEAENIALIVGAMIEKRNELGLTQRQLAQMCGIPQSSVARIESYKTTPNLDTILKIMQPLGLTLSVVSLK